MLLGGLSATVGRIRTLTPVLRMAIAYPLRNRFRTGVTFAMFTLVVFTLVVGAVVTGSFVKAFDDPEKFGGGFDIRRRLRRRTRSAGWRRRSAVHWPRPGAVHHRLGAVARGAGPAGRPLRGEELEDYGLRGLDDAFLRNTTFGFAAKARGYGSAGEIWMRSRRSPASPSST